MNYKKLEEALKDLDKILHEGLPITSLSGIETASKKIGDKWGDRLTEHDVAQMIAAVLRGIPEEKRYDLFKSAIRLIKK